MNNPHQSDERTLETLQAKWSSAYMKSRFDAAAQL